MGIGSLQLIRDGTKKGLLAMSAGPRNVRNVSTRTARVSLGLNLVVGRQHGKRKASQGANRY
jgi:hypothetical protein